MTMFQALESAIDGVLARLVAGLESEFGPGADAALAQQFLDAEEVDFLWEARLSERWVGAYESVDDEDRSLDRVEILGRLDGRWFVAVSIVDGDGNAQGLIGRHSFLDEAAAREAYTATH